MRVSIITSHIPLLKDRKSIDAPSASQSPFKVHSTARTEVKRRFSIVKGFGTVRFVFPVTLYGEAGFESGSERARQSFSVDKIYFNERGSGGFNQQI